MEGKPISLRPNYAVYCCVCFWYVFVFWCETPQWAMASSFTRFLDHTQRRTAVGRTPLYEWSARRRDLYLTTNNIPNRQTSMSHVGFEPTTPAGQRPQTYALGYSYIGTRTDATQQTNICLGTHRRHVALHSIRYACPYLTDTLQRHSNPTRTAAGVWPDCRLQTNSLCWHQTVGGDNIPVVSVSV